MARTLQPPPLDVKEFNAPEWQQFLLSLRQAVVPGSAPATAPFLTYTTSTDLSAAQNLGALVTGFGIITTVAGVATISTVSAIPTTSLSGFLQAAQFPALTGDATTVAGSLVVTVSHATNASTATALQTARLINGVSFNGTANITVTAAAGTLTGATLAAGVTASSLTSVSTLVGGATGVGFTIALSTSTVTGTLADARLSANVPLLNAANVFVAAVTMSTLAVTGATTVSADIAWANNTGFGLIGFDGVRFLSYTTAGGVVIGSGAAKVNCAVPLQLPGYTVATLPAGTQGFLAYATDLLGPTFLANAVGGGAVKGPVFYNGANWVTV